MTTDIRDRDVVLRDGSLARIRAVGHRDRTLLEAFVRSLSRSARLARFNSVAIDPRSVAIRWSDGGADTYGLVALDVPEVRIVAHAEYVRTGARTAEVAFETANDRRGVGLATLLLGRLAERARARDIAIFEAYVLPSNREMAAVFRDSRFSATTTLRDGFYLWELVLQSPGVSPRAAPSGATPARGSP